MLTDLSNENDKSQESSTMNCESGVFNDELITNLPHYRQIIAFQEIDNTSTKINPWTLSKQTEGITLWKRTRDRKSNNSFSKDFHWRTEERLISYFIIKNDEPEEYIVYQEKKYNMNVGRMMYFKIQIATPAILKYNKIILCHSHKL
jgi:hypothetical protein